MAQKELEEEQFCERVLGEGPEKVVNLHKQGRGIKSGSSLHIHSNKQGFQEGYSLEHHVYPWNGKLWMKLFLKVFLM